MSAKAAGAYLWELRKKKKLSRDKAADLLGTARSQIERMEYGNSDTLAPIFMAFIRLVDGDHNEVTDLLLEKDAKTVTRTATRTSRIRKPRTISRGNC